MACVMGRGSSVSRNVSRPQEALTHDLEMWDWEHSRCLTQGDFPTPMQDVPPLRCRQTAFSVANQAWVNRAFSQHSSFLGP